MNKTLKQIRDCYKLATAALQRGMKTADIGLLSLLAMTQDFSQNPQNSVTHVGFGGAPDLSEFKGAVKYKLLTGKTLVIKDKTWTAGEQIARTDIENDALGLFLDSVKDMGNKAKTHPVRLLIDMLVGGEGTSYGLAYDGASFFSDSHVGYKGATQKNLVSRTLAKNSAYTREQFKADFIAAVAQMQDLKDEDDGEAFFSDDIAYKDLLVVVPAAYRNLAEELFMSEKIDNVTNPYYGVQIRTSGKVKAGEWYLLYVGSSQKPFIYQPMSDVETTSNMNGTDEAVMDNEIYKFKVRRRYNNGYAFWQMAAKVKITEAAS
ncbi:Mu-like prophage major head subunit gpT family protein [Candidatus Avelusimicrobium fimicolum]|jgi:phage major head subunit gpT-like protein|uniref:Mu-like prophage major head subunit gpT family protein n=1 Tax=Candidatus Avelusimicrobium fimicolum TaxID=3416216 RepID=UPI003D10D97D